MAMLHKIDIWINMVKGSCQNTTWREEIYNLLEKLRQGLAARLRDGRDGRIRREKGD